MTKGRRNMKGGSLRDAILYPDRKRDMKDDGDIPQDVPFDILSNPNNQKKAFKNYNENDNVKEGSTKISLYKINHDLRLKAHRDGIALLKKWKESRSTAIIKIMSKFDENGIPREPPTATTFSDLYKWTMMPVILKLEQYKKDCTVTFGIDLRDKSMRDALKRPTSDITNPLVDKIHKSLKGLKERKFKRDVFQHVLQGPRAHIFTIDGVGDTLTNINNICGTGDNSLADVIHEFGVEPNRAEVYEKVNIFFYYKSDAIYNPDESDLAKQEKGVHFIEAVGPWHRVTWLETSIMQCVYETKLRHDLGESPEAYANWLHGALLRCAKSICFTRLVQKQFGKPTPALFTGRRTGGLLFLLLQNLMLADTFMQFVPPTVGQSKPSEYSLLAITPDSNATPCLGTSSCDSSYILNDLKLPCLAMVGTNAHEMRMVTSILYPQLDQNVEGLPLSQLVADYLYYRLVWSKTKGPMPALPDTVGTRAFLKAATFVKFEDTPLLQLIGAARQDSGDLKDFIQNMTDFGYKGAMMASEIDTCLTLVKAADFGYATFGAGGFFGDSIKVWSQPSTPANSMAVKAVRVLYDNAGGLPIDEIPYMEKLSDNMVIGYPVKLGDAKTLSKLSIDKTLPMEKVQVIKEYYKALKAKAGMPGQKLGNASNHIPEPINITDIFTFATGEITPIKRPLEGSLEGSLGGGRRRRRRTQKRHHKKRKRTHKRRSA